MNQKTVMGLLHGLFYLDVALAVSFISMPSAPLPRYFYPIEPPVIIYPSPYETDCWVGSESHCWLNSFEM